MGFGTRLGAAALAAVLAVGGALPAASEIVLRRGNGAESESLDVHKTQGQSESFILQDLFEGLTTRAADGTSMPGAAASWEVTPDGLVYTFHLRENGRWSNGDPVTAHDFVYALRRVVNPMTAAQYVFFAYPIVNAQALASGDIKDLEKLGVKALDAATLQITLRSPTPYFTDSLTHQSMMPVHPPTVEKYGNRWPRPEHMVSNGAYMLAAWVPQDYVKIVRNPYFHAAETVAIDTVFYYNTEDLSAEFRRFRAGELDTTLEIPSDAYGWIRENIPDQARIAPYLSTYYYAFNLKNPKFQDVRVRQALAMIIDRKILAEKINKSGDLPAYSWVPPGVNGYTPARVEWADWTQGERDARARELMAEAGYSRSNPLEVEIHYNTNENHKRRAIAIAAFWRKLGVKATLKNEEWKVYLVTRNRFEFEISRAGWVADFNDAATYLDLLRSDAGPMNPSAYANPEYDALIDRSRLEMDPVRRADLMQRAEAIALRDMPIIPIYSYVTKHLVKKYVKGWVNNVMDVYLSRWMSIEQPQS